MLEFPNGTDNSEAAADSSPRRNGVPKNAPV
jgi:hypothetical protein